MSQSSSGATSRWAFSGPRPPVRFNMAAYAVGRAARATPDKPALNVVREPGEPPVETWTFAQIEDAVLRCAAGLKDLGLPTGSRILIRLENTSAYALLFFGAIAGGFVPLPTSTHLTEPEADFLIRDSGAAAVALADHLPQGGLPDGVMALSADTVTRLLRHPRRADYADTSADDPAYLIYTSGTTANPKGVLHAQRAAWGRRPMYDGWYGLTDADRMLHAGAFNWTYTLGTGLTDPWVTGATSIISVGAKEPGLWPRLIRETGATIFAGVPSLYRQILKYAGADARDLGRLRHGLIAGETPPPGLVEAFEAETGRTLYEALGMSEISTYVSSSPSVPPKAGFIGRPQPGRSIAILGVDGGETPLAPGEEGLLAVHRSDPGLMLGYLGRPDEEAAVMRGQWFIGGDLAMMDAYGYIAHCGRANDLMKALGYRVSPLEVEAVIARHPDVGEVACAEVEVREGVHVIGAYVVTRDGAEPPAADALMAFAATSLAPYKCPREIIHVAALPRTANGKVKRSALAQLRRA